MPVSKNRKNHKQKVQSWKKKNELITKSFNKKLREAIASQNNPNLENGQMKIEVK